MKQEILRLLTEKFQGVSEVILGRIADKLAKTATEDTIASVVEGVTIQQVIDSNADYRVTEAVKTARKNYESEQKEPKAIGGEPKSQPQTDDTPEWAKALISDYQKLQEQVAQINKEKIATSRKQQLSSVIDKLPEPIKRMAERTNIDGLSDDEFSVLISDITKDANDIAGELKIKGAVTGKPSTDVKLDQTPKASEAELDEVLKKLNL